MDIKGRQEFEALKELVHSLAQRVAELEQRVTAFDAPAPRVNNHAQLEASPD